VRARLSAREEQIRQVRGADEQDAQAGDEEKLIGRPSISLPTPDDPGGLTDITFGWKPAGSASAVAIDEAAFNLMNVNITLNILALYTRRTAAGMTLGPTRPRVHQAVT
jgi:hypothetical protein